MIKYKQIVIASAAAFAAMSSYALESVSLYNQPLSSLKSFSVQSNLGSNRLLTSRSNSSNTLELVSTSHMGDKTYQRLQQKFHGIDVVGKSVTVESASYSLNSVSDSSSNVNGELVKDLNISTIPEVNANKVLDLAQNLFNKGYLGYQIDQDGKYKPEVKLQILVNENNKAKLVYLVSLYGEKLGNQPVWMNYYFNANTAQLISAWDNIQTFEDIGPGGNEKTHEYWYGEGNMPTLDVSNSGLTCIMNNERVKAVNMEQGTKSITEPFTYTCGLDRGDAINGSYSALDDAFYFGDIIINMYSDWYNIKALKNADGSAMQLVMRVHYDYNYENAFWNGKNMTFGDGDPEGRFYPFVSLDVAGHEVSHGFTEQHSGLIYKDESGSLNEAYSDMAGQAVRAYLLSQSGASYNKFYPGDPQGEISWGVGETITRGEGQSLRYMNQPSDDGYSADCYDKALATQSGGICEITYDDVVEAAKDAYPWPWQSGSRQGHIVHKGSGVFNKAFYLISMKWYQQKLLQGDQNAYVDAIEEAFRIMVLANIKYWNKADGFSVAACGVEKSANELGYSVSDVKDAFNQVGVNTSSCRV